MPGTPASTLYKNTLNLYNTFYTVYLQNYLQIENYVVNQQELW
jgi:hypothetical protein